MTTATLVYTVPEGGAPLAPLAAAVAAVPFPKGILELFGLRLLTDVTVEGPPVVRTVTLSLGPITTATAVAGLIPSEPTGSRIDSVTVSAKGSGYVVPPVVKFSDATGSGAKALAYLDVKTAVVAAGGDGYPDQVAVVFYGGLPPGSGVPGDTKLTYQQVLRASVSAGGSGYSPKTVVGFLGGLSPRGKPATGAVRLKAGVIVGIDIDYGGEEYIVAPTIVIVDPTGEGSGGGASAYMVPGKEAWVRGVPATATATVEAGVVTTVTLASHGSGYTDVPQALIIGSSGSAGAIIALSMEVNAVVMLAKGAGYTEPTVALVPYFESLFPAGGDQRAPLFNILTTNIQNQAATTVVASAPVLS